MLTITVLAPPAGRLSRLVASDAATGAQAPEDVANEGAEDHRAEGDEQESPSGMRRAPPIRINQSRLLATIEAVNFGRGLPGQLGEVHGDQG